jgi:hypothetical protein
VNIVRRSNEEMRTAKGRIDAEKLNTVMEEDIAHWKREDGVDDASLGPPHFVSAGPDVRMSSSASDRIERGGSAV